MEDEWTKVMSGGRLLEFTYFDLQRGGAFLTAQIAGHQVVYLSFGNTRNTHSIAKALSVHSPVSVRPFQTDPAVR
jgi:hypothetical protein